MSKVVYLQRVMQIFNKLGYPTEALCLSVNYWGPSFGTPIMFPKMSLINLGLCLLKWVCPKAVWHKKMYFLSDIFKVRWDGFTRCTQKEVTRWPRTSHWTQYRKKGCGTASRIERPNSWWPLKQWRMVRMVRIDQNSLILSASTSWTNPAVASLVYLSNILSAPCQCKSYITSEEHSDLENSIWKADRFTTAHLLESRNLG